jgi:hypothetical protein
MLNQTQSTGTLGIGFSVRRRSLSCVVRAELIQLEPVQGSSRVGNTRPVVKLGSHRQSWLVRAAESSMVSASWAWINLEKKQKLRDLCAFVSDTMNSG